MLHYISGRRFAPSVSSADELEANIREQVALGDNKTIVFKSEIGSGEELW